MERLTVLEFVRHQEPTWTLPRHCVTALQSRFPDVAFLAPADQEEADRVLPQADVVLGWAVQPANFARAERLRWIQVTAASVARLMFPALVDSPVIVTNGRGLHAAAMAEHTIGVILMYARKLHLTRDAQRERRWIQTPIMEGPPFLSFAGSTLGLVGFGAIGREIAVKARALGARVLAVRRHPSPDAAPADAQWGSDRLDELLEQCDWLVLAAPLTAETSGMIGARELARLKPGALLVNLGRGPLVDEAALIAAIEQGALAGAALDVFDEEPLPPESPLWAMPQVILTPHVSGLAPRLWERSMDLFARNLDAFRNGRPLENLVDKRAGY
jgi:phosphoglycerate dehydrogenase-like enzyme